MHWQDYDLLRALKSEVGLESTSQLRRRLKNVGISNAAINAAWPDWWSDAASDSVSAQADLRFSLARKLGLDPRSLLDDSREPRFIWHDEARFKHLSGEGRLELSAITSFGSALGRLLAASFSAAALPTLSATELREVILGKQPYVRLVDMLSFCWSVGIPVVHLRVFPTLRKRMAAMSVRIDGRYVILMGKDAMYPPHIAFYLAHELGHIALGHLSQASAIVDLETKALSKPGSDPDEVSADRFALQLLTGFTEPKVLSKSKTFNANQLAHAVSNSATELRIEPGTLALCFGFSTGQWLKTNAAIKRIYLSPSPVASVINKVASDHLDLSLIPDDARSYVRAALGAESLPA